MSSPTAPDVAVLTPSHTSSHNSSLSRRLTRLLLAFLLLLCFLATLTTIIYLNLHETPTTSSHKDALIDQFTPTPSDRIFDLVGAIPDASISLPYRTYSGYLESLDNNRLFYWFFESASPIPASDPLILWLNGGPGCSSLYGAFSELGPIRMEMNGSFTVNPHAWNQRANVLFLESPAGTGFSYRPDTPIYRTNDEDTAKANFVALKSFFAKFPALLNNSFYITGESYAGRYIPQLSIEVLMRNYPPNFKGIAIGNGYLDPDLERSTFSHFIAHHNLIAFSRTLSNADPPINKSVYKYNILKDCVASYPSQYGYVVNFSFNRTDRHPSSEPIEPCGNEIQLTEYLNRPDVQRALHVHADSGVGSWSICSLLKSDYMDYDENYEMPTMRETVREIVQAGIKVLIYSGDMDIVCNFMAAQKFVNDLGFRNISYAEPWTYQGRSIGLINRYASNLTFIQYYGAGHMVPIDMPEEALYMINTMFLD